MTREQRLETYIEATKGKVAQWGVDDCTAWVAGWIEVETGYKVDLPNYHDKNGADKLIQKFGGVVGLWGHCLNGAPVSALASFEEPEFGDIGLLDTYRHGLVGVIVLKGGILAWRGSDNVHILRHRGLVKAWRV